MDTYFDFFILWYLRCLHIIKVLFNQYDNIILRSLKNRDNFLRDKK